MATKHFIIYSVIFVIAVFMTDRQGEKEGWGKYRVLSLIDNSYFKYVFTTLKQISFTSHFAENDRK